MDHVAEPANTAPQADRDLGPLPALDRQRQQKLFTWCVLSAVWVLSAAYAAHYCTRGWIPNDDGTLAQSALRVLEGQLPHRDFMDPYTGGLSYFHAGAFRAFGINLVSLRVAVFIVCLLWVPAVFYVASRFLSPISAGGVTLLAVVWGYPNYPAAMPSWYNLFLAVFGIAALLRYLEVGTSRWLFLAGVAGALSCLVKVIGFYYVAGVLLFFIFRRQTIHGSSNRATAKPAMLYCTVVASFLLALLTLIVGMMRTRLGSGELFQFVLPAAALAGLLFIRELRTRAAAGESFRALVAMAAPFALGMALPMAAYLIPYALSGAVLPFFRDLFVRTAVQVSLTGGLVRPAGLGMIVFAIPLVLCLLFAVAHDRSIGRWGNAAFAAALAAALLLAAQHAGMSRAVWFSATMFTPLVAVFGALILLLRPSFADNLSEKREQQVMLVLSIASLCGLVQFPFAAPIYFCYFAPLTVLAVAALLATQKRAPGHYLLASLLAFYLLYAVLRVGPSFVYATLDVGSSPQTRVLLLPRAAGLRVQVEEAPPYEQIIPVVQEHAGGQLLLAVPECPELYFLSKLRNPTPDDRNLQRDELLENVARDQVREVVINQRPVFAASHVPEDLKRQLAAEFPNSISIGKYLIRWRR